MAPLLFLPLLLHGAPAAAWGTLGHRLICRIAWLELEPAPRREIARLMQQADRRRFEDACNWPDRIRDDPEWEWTSPEHYLNVPRQALRARPADCPVEGCILRALERYHEILDSDATDRERLQALLFLSHYLGDIHQPLHVAYADDRGGNDVMVSWRGRRTSLHALWDSRLLSPDRNPSWSKLARELWRTAGAGKHAWLAATTLDWADESLALTRRIYRDLPPDREPDERDLQAYRPLARERIQQAGIRLGERLNDLLAARED